MSEKLLFENLLVEAEPTAEPISTPAAGDATPTADETNPGVTLTSTDDIAKTEPKIGFANSIASRSLPATLGFVQPMNSPSGYVFGLKSGPGVSVGNTAEDAYIARRSVNTGLRQVTVDVTNEVVQDIDALFGSNFVKVYKNYLFYDGRISDPYEVPTGTDAELSKFFLSYATWKMSRKTNEDFIDWMGLQATNVGTLTLGATEDFSDIKFAVSELKAKLADTGKVGKTWVLSSPEIINYLLMDLKISGSKDGGMIERRKPTAEDYNYVFTLGDIDFYQDAYITDNKIYAGIKAGPDAASVFYTPYKEYFVQGGEDWKTGQSNVFFRLRDAWTTNPLDSSANNDTNDSSFLVYCSVDLTGLSPIITAP